LDNQQELSCCQENISKAFAHQSHLFAVDLDEMLVDNQVYAVLSVKRQKSKPWEQPSDVRFVVNSNDNYPKYEHGKKEEFVLRVFFRKLSTIVSSMEIQIYKRRRC